MELAFQILSICLYNGKERNEDIKEKCFMNQMRFVLLLFFSSILSLFVFRGRLMMLQQAALNNLK